MQHHTWLYRAAQNLEPPASQARAPLTQLLSSANSLLKQQTNKNKNNFPGKYKEIQTLDCQP